MNSDQRSFRDLPLVSIIVPCYNESGTIQQLLDALYFQTYPKEKLEVIISDGMSTDNTREAIAAFQIKHPDFNVKILDNPKKIIPAALNIGWKAAKGEYIIRLDAHSVPHNDHVSQCVSALEAGVGDNVGGVWIIRPGEDSWVARSIATAASHPLGVGNARYRVGGTAQEVDTVPFGAYRRSLIQKIGPFDESLLANEDYEFNVRIRNSGGIIWFDPAIRTYYLARSTFKALAQQYWRYGYWKFRMLLRYPKTFRMRQISGAFVFNWLVIGFLAIWFLAARWILLGETLIYSLSLLIAGIHMSLKNRDITLLIGGPLAIATMHFTWGSGFLWSAGEYGLSKRERSI